MKRAILWVSLVWGAALPASAASLTLSQIDGAVGRPEVLLLLLLITIYGILGAVSHPRAIIPGIVGALAFVGLLYTTRILPINLAGFALVALAVVLCAAEAFSQSGGSLMVGGIACFFVGSLMLFENSPGRLSVLWLVPATLLTAAFFAFVVANGLALQFQPRRAGGEPVLGRRVPALTRIDPHSGKVCIDGEYWNAVSDVPIQPGQPVEIIGHDELTVRVQPPNALRPPDAAATKP